VSYYLYMTRNLSVSELANVVANPVLLDDPKLVLRQLRHWSTLGILPPDGATFVGHGNHRRYSRDAVFLATILVRMAAAGFSVGVLKALAAIVEEKMLKDAAGGRQLWEAAIAGEAAVDLRFRVVRHAASDTVYQAEAQIETRGHVPEVPEPASTVPTHLMNLTEFFAPVRARLGE